MGILNISLSYLRINTHVQWMRPKDWRSISAGVDFNADAQATGTGSVIGCYCPLAAIGPWRDHMPSLKSLDVCIIEVCNLATIGSLFSFYVSA